MQHDHPDRRRSGPYPQTGYPQDARPTGGYPPDAPGSYGQPGGDREPWRSGQRGWDPMVDRQGAGGAWSGAAPSGGGWTGDDNGDNDLAEHAGGYRGGPSAGWSDSGRSDRAGGTWSGAGAWGDSGRGHPQQHQRGRGTLRQGAGFDSGRSHGEGGYGFEADHPSYAQRRWAGAAGGQHRSPSRTESLGADTDSGPDEGSQQPFDPDYHQWRTEQLRALDDDYRQWRQDRYRKFSDEFSSWRTGRAGQRGGGTSTPGQDEASSASSGGSGSGSSSSGGSSSGGSSGSSSGRSGSKETGKDGGK